VQLSGISRAPSSKGKVDEARGLELGRQDARGEEARPPAATTYHAGANGFEVARGAPSLATIGPKPGRTSAEAPKRRIGEVISAGAPTTAGATCRLSSHEDER